MNADLYLDSNCAQRGGKIADHMSTTNVVRDLDQLRQAVGDEKLTYAGFSYGTMIGQTYANMFPNDVRALIIDGVLDPIAWTTGSGDGATVPFSTRLHSDIGAQATLQEFFRLCDAGTCAFDPNSAARLKTLGDSVKAHPLVVTNPDGHLWRSTIRSSLRSRSARCTTRCRGRTSAERSRHSRPLFVGLLLAALPFLLATRARCDYFPLSGVLANRRRAPRLQRRRLGARARAACTARRRETDPPRSRLRPRLPALTVLRDRLLEKLTVARR
jgi:pimeloyl-ACP methyl ester carboxylesterase